MATFPLTLEHPEVDVGATAADDDRDAALARQDPAEFEPLYRRHVGSVYRYLRTRTPDDETAAELTSITFERALASIAQYRGDGAGFIGWLLRIARNAAIDARRRQRPMERLDAVAERPSTAPTPDALAIAADDARLVREYLDRLPETQREALTLRFGLGLSSRAIAPLIGRSEAATQKLITRALHSLRESLDDHR